MTMVCKWLPRAEPHPWRVWLGFLAWLTVLCPVYNPVGESQPPDVAPGKDFHLDNPQVGLVYIPKHLLALQDGDDFDPTQQAPFLHQQLVLAGYKVSKFWAHSASGSHPPHPV